MTHFKTLLVIAGLALSTAAVAATDGTADFNVPAGRLASFNYTADMAAGHITGQLFGGTSSTVDLTMVRGAGWQGMMGNGGVAANGITLQANGSESLEIHTIRGIFEYTIETKANGDLEIRTVSPRGNILTASLTNKGRTLSAGMLNSSFEITEDANHPGYFDGTLVNGIYSNDIYLDSQGTLIPANVAAQDHGLFVLLYVLPFDLDL